MSEGYSEIELGVLECRLGTFPLNADEIQAVLPAGFTVTHKHTSLIDVLTPDGDIISVDQRKGQDTLLERVRAHAVVLSL